MAGEGGAGADGDGDAEAGGGRSGATRSGGNVKTSDDGVGVVGNDEDAKSGGDSIVGS